MFACPLIRRLFVRECSQNTGLSNKSPGQMQSQEVDGRHPEESAVWSRNYSCVLAVRKKLACIPLGQAWHGGPAQM